MRHLHPFPAWLFAALLMSGLYGGCHRPPTTPQPIATMTPAPPPLPALLTALHIRPLQLSLSHVDSFDLALSVINQGPDTLDPELHNAKLRVNGEFSIAFMLAVGNGVREEKWFALPPGERADIHWNMWNLFPEPGTYTLVLDWHGMHEAVVVTVSP
jgi:hypothetical protein